MYSGDLLAKSGTERFQKRRRKNVKLLSIAIPCYNSEAYMEHCINTLLTGGDEVEIIIVDDGSQKDRTPEIADEYERKYPGICRAVHQENGGHGQAVNTGLKNATGVFFKVVDSDDWAKASTWISFRVLMRRLRSLNIRWIMIRTSTRNLSARNTCLHGGNSVCLA